MNSDKLHILIVDDDPEIREILKENLPEDSYVVTSASSAEEALAIRQLERVDVAVIDIHLQGKLNGQQFVQELRKRAPDAEFILMSGKANVDDIIGIFKADVFSFLKKPFHSLEEIRLLIERAGRTKRLAAQNRDYEEAIRVTKERFDAELAERTEELQKIRFAVSHLFEVSTQLGRIEPPDSLLNFVCRAVVDSGAFDRAVILLADAKFRIRNVGSWPPSTAAEWEQSVQDVRGQPLRPFMFGVSDEKYGSAWILDSKPALDPDYSDSGTRQVTFPLVKSDGTIVGFLSADSVKNDMRKNRELFQYLEILLNHSVLQIESLSLRDELVVRANEMEARVQEKTQELRLSQEKFIRLVNLTTDIVYIADRDDKIVYLNDAFEKTLGYTRENYVGRVIQRVLDEIATDDLVNNREIASLLSRSVENAICQVEVLTRSGDKRILEVNRTWIRQGGEITGSQGIVRDVTEYRALLQRLMSSDRLAATGKLAAGIAHEINNPLQAMASHLSAAIETIKEKKDPAESLATIRESIERIRIIVRGLLDLNRAQSGPRMEIELRGVIEKVLVLLQKQFKESSIEVAANYSAEPLKIVASPGEIQQVFLNILLNALDAMENGGVIQIETEKSEQEAVVRIHDNGSGIREEHIGKLFEPFSSFRLKGGGTGLGLYLSKNIVELHGGTISAASEFGKGSTFTIRLPLLES